MKTTAPNITIEELIQENEELKTKQERKEVFPRGPILADPLTLSNEEITQLLRGVNLHAAMRELKNLRMTDLVAFNTILHFFHSASA